MSDGPVVGVVGADVASTESAITGAGGVVTAGAATTVVGDSDYIVAVGESALLAVARADPDVPVLPVGSGSGVRSVRRDDVGEAIEALLAGNWTRDNHPMLDVTVADRMTVSALQDVMLASAEPAQISEYAVETADEAVAGFRADGFVVATPAGSNGYANAAGGPIIPPDSNVVTVVPVAPFSTDVDHWVLPLAELRVSVERDETAVNLVADDRVVGPVKQSDTVTITPGDQLEVAVVASSQSCFGQD